MTTRRTFMKEASCAAGFAAAACAVGCSNGENSKEAKMDMKFSELIEARRSVRKYTQPYFKNPRKPVAEVLKAV